MHHFTRAFTTSDGTYVTFEILMQNDNSSLVEEQNNEILFASFSKFQYHFKFPIHIFYLIKSYWNRLFIFHWLALSAMLKNLKHLSRRGFNLNSYSSPVVFNKALPQLSLKPQPQLHIEFRRMFSSENKRPENKGPENKRFENNEFIDPEFINLRVGEKVWKSPLPLLFQNGEMKLYSVQARQLAKNGNIAIYTLLSGLTLFSGLKLYDYPNRTWYGALFYFLLGGVALRNLISAAKANNYIVTDLYLLNDGKRIKIATQRLGFQTKWDIIEINKIQMMPQTMLGIGHFFTVGDEVYLMPRGIVPNLEVLHAALEGYNIDTSNFEEEITVKS